MRGRPDEEVLKELMDDMNAMDREKLGKKRQGPSITIAVGMPKDDEKMEEACEACGGKGCPACEAMKSEMPMGDSMPAEMPMDDDDEEDDEEDLLIEEAKALGIEEPEYMDMRLLKKLVEKKKAQG